MGPPAPEPPGGWNPEKNFLGITRLLPQGIQNPLVFEALEIKGFAVLEILRDPTREYKTPLFLRVWRTRGVCIRVRTNEALVLVE